MKWMDPVPLFAASFGWSMHINGRTEHLIFSLNSSLARYLLSTETSHSPALFDCCCLTIDIKRKKD